MNENDAFYNALIDVAAWDKENTLDRFMNSDSLFKKFLYKFITTDGSYVKLRSSLVERDLENAKLYSHTLKGIAANLGLVNLFDVSNNILSVSYTHLDVYKRQGLGRAVAALPPPRSVS